ncbi:putative transcriptional regulator, PucR family [Caldalkalibacillus thermarum TA2.A1]|uniref:Putative transcriptional regulator, PucR family n=1 Tax=Caldalkalibacillus thermarum (strain TA2.A1) TaxID=986075 RepID=F5L8D7_CALTT|nr:PucR family transcriptional regulator [Caldalkalibacillus thermarum]EGL82370.1 putative transcriptional regulator, PucR family [Caldalkalibacillus thermarum TA2.A1]
MKGALPNRNPFKGLYEDLESFVDRISDMLSCPITLEDANHRLLAYSTHDDRTDPARTATIMGRRVPEKVINSLWKNGVIPQLMASDEPIRVKKITDIGLDNRVAISIRQNEEVLGYIWALDMDHTLDDEKLALLKQAAEAARKLLLKRQAHKYKREAGHQELLWQLLTGHADTEEEIKAKFEQLKLTFPAMATVIVFQFAQDVDARLENKLGYILKTSQRIKPVLSTTDGHQFILLAAPQSQEAPLKDFQHFIPACIALMKERFGVFPMLGACGSIQRHLPAVEKSYKEAQYVLDIKEKFAEDTEKIYTYQDLGIYQFLDVIADKRKRDGSVNHALQKLYAYDQQHNSQLVKTLDVYLNKDTNLNETAKALHIHVNTLNYRLKRIAEIGEINLSDPNQKMMLYIDLKINKYTAKGHL